MSVSFPAQNACSSHPCKHGTCHNQGTSYSCACSYGYTGTNCDQGMIYFIQLSTLVLGKFYVKANMLHSVCGGEGTGWSKFGYFSSTY